MRISTLSMLLCLSLLSFNTLADGDSFSKALGKILGGQEDPSRRESNQRINKTVTDTIFGDRLSRNLTSDDRRIVAESLEHLHVNGRYDWVNNDSNNRYTIIINTKYIEEGNHCKRFTIKARIDGRWENKQSHGCRIGAGNWRIYGLSTPKKRKDADVKGGDRT